MATAATDANICVEMGENAYEMEKTEKKLLRIAEEVKLLEYRERELHDRVVENPKMLLGKANNELTLVVMKVEREGRLGTCQDLYIRLVYESTLVRKIKMERTETEKRAKERDDIMAEVKRLNE